MPDMLWNLLGLWLIKLGIKTLIGNERKQMCAIMHIGYRFAQDNPQAFLKVVQGHTSLQFARTEQPK